MHEYADQLHNLGFRERTQGKTKLNTSRRLDRHEHSRKTNAPNEFDIAEKLRREELCRSELGELMHVDKDRIRI